MFYYLCYVRPVNHINICCFIGVRANDEDHARNEAAIYLQKDYEVVSVERIED